MNWRQHAGCRGHDPDLWYSHDPADKAAARRICRTGCPVQDACLDYALTTHTDSDDSGIWGGTDAPQRRHLRATAQQPPTMPPAAADQMVDVAEQADGVLVDPTGRATIVPVNRQPRWIVIVDDRVVARSDSLDAGRRAAWQAMTATTAAA